MNGTATFPTSGFVRVRQIIGNRKAGEIGPIPISRSAWWQGVKDGRFPAGVKLGPRTTAWRAEDILALIDRLGGVA